MEGVSSVRASQQSKRFLCSQVFRTVRRAKGRGSSGDDDGMQTFADTKWKRFARRAIIEQTVWYISWVQEEESASRCAVRGIRSTSGEGVISNYFPAIARPLYVSSLTLTLEILGNWHDNDDVSLTQRCTCSVRCDLRGALDNMTSAQICPK